MDILCKFACSIIIDIKDEKHLQIKPYLLFAIVFDSGNAA